MDTWTYGDTKGTYDSSTERKVPIKVHEINDQNGNIQGLFWSTVYY